MNSLSLIGTYRVDVSEGEMRFIAEHVCGSMESAFQEVAGLTLVEIVVRNASPDFDIGLLHQEDTDQVAWDEHYFSVDGTELLNQQPRTGDFRVCFFLHLFQVTKKI